MNVAGISQIHALRTAAIGGPRSIIVGGCRHFELEFQRTAAHESVRFDRAGKNVLIVRKKKGVRPFLAGNRPSGCFAQEGADTFSCSVLCHRTDFLFMGGVDAS